ncbi:MAG TPA: hypothetical protein VGM21_21515 [Actinomycetota bacterium]
MSTREPVGTPPPHRAGWLAKWEKTNSELQRLKAKHPMLDAVIDQVDGRRIRIGRQWLVDYASCNYLGFDLDPRSWRRCPRTWPSGAPTRAGPGCSAARCCTSRSRTS